eukprot:scaffold1481_cov401-Prasinococcus_capsulatus_cf.AAC.12
MPRAGGAETTRSQPLLHTPTPTLPACLPACLPLRAPRRGPPPAAAHHVVGGPLLATPPRPRSVPPRRPDDEDEDDPFPRSPASSAVQAPGGAARAEGARRSLPRPPLPLAKGPTGRRALASVPPPPHIYIGPPYT